MQGLGGDNQDTLAYLGIVQCFSQIEQGLAQTLARRGFRLAGPKQGDKTRPLARAPLDPQIGEQTTRIIRGELCGFAIDPDLKTTQKGED